MTAERATQAFERFLAEEDHALRIGALGELAQMAPRKEALLTTLAQARPAPDPATLERLKAHAAHNGALLHAALNGLRAARQRLQAARDAAAGVNTYDNTGQRQKLGSPPATLERRA